MRYLKEKGLASPADVRGRLRVPASFGAVEADEEVERDPAPENPLVVALDVSDSTRRSGSARDLPRTWAC